MCTFSNITGKTVSSTVVSQMRILNSDSTREAIANLANIVKTELVESSNSYMDRVSGVARICR
jgi:hypothetical protein